MQCAVTTDLNRFLANQDKAEFIAGSSESYLEGVLTGEKLPVVNSLAEIIADIEPEALFNTLEDLYISCRLNAFEQKNEALNKFQDLVTEKAESIIAEEANQIHDALMIQIEEERAIERYEAQQAAEF